MNLNELPVDLAQFVQQKVAEGKYQSAAEVVNAALRLLQEHEAKGSNGQQSPHGSASAHQIPPPLEQVGTLIGGFHPVLVDVRQSELAHRCREARLFSRPLSERRPETVHRYSGTH